MKAMIIYDSFFGNTEKIAQQIAGVLSSHGEVTTLKADQATPDQVRGLDLIVLGSPTRAFTYSPNIKTFLNKLDAGALKGVRVAAFDTRFKPGQDSSKFLKGMVKLLSYAAGPMLKAMEKKGGTPVVPISGFAVKDSEGPLMDGELERAAAWAEEILSGL
ncbi:MAG: flavodoxin family protein [Anaerolineaceae bacterium]